MRALLERPGAILSREQLEQRIYGWDEEVCSNTVDVLILGVRRKFGAEVIRNVRPGLARARCWSHVMRAPTSLRRELVQWLLPLYLLTGLLLGWKFYEGYRKTIDRFMDGQMEAMAETARAHRCETLPVAPLERDRCARGRPLRLAALV